MHKPANDETASKVKINVVLQGFLGDVDSLREVFDLVVPLLESQDEQRRQAYKAARETLQEAQQSGDDPNIAALPMIGRTISHYRIVEKLGAMAVVYKRRTKLAA